MTHYDFNKNEELADWIRAVGRWKSRQRELKTLIQDVQNLLRDREEIVEEALWMRATAFGDDLEEADKALSKAVAMAQREHEATVKKLTEIHNDLAASQGEDLFERPETMASSPQRDRVEEASRQSFPASDPPSFNPGQA